MKRRLAAVCAAILMASALSGCGTYQRAFDEVFGPGDPSGAPNRTSASSANSPRPGKSAKPQSLETGKGAPPFDPDTFYSVYEEYPRTLRLSEPIQEQPRYPSRPPITSTNGKYLRVSGEPYRSGDIAAFALEGYPWLPEDDYSKDVFVCLCRPDAPLDVPDDLWNCEDNAMLDRDGAWEWSMPGEEGVYEIRLVEREDDSEFDEERITVVDTATLTVRHVRGTGATVESNKETYRPNEDITIRFGGVDCDEDEYGWYVGIYRLGAGPNDRVGDIAFLNDIAGDSVILKVPSCRGTYEARLYAAYGEWDSMAARASFTVEAGYEIDGQTPLFIGGGEASDWAFDEVNLARMAGLVPSGLTSDLQAGITRGEFAELCVRACERLTGDLIILEPPSGPDEPVTNEEAAVMLQRALACANEYFLPDCSVPFREENASAFGASEWAHDAVLYLMESGALDEEGGAYDPGAVCTREEAVVLVYRAVVSVAAEPLPLYYASRPEKGIDPLLLGSWSLTSSSGSLVNAWGDYTTWSGMGTTYTFHADGTFDIVLVAQGSVIGKYSQVESGRYRVTAPGEVLFTDIRLTKMDNGIETSSGHDDFAMRYIVGEDEYGAFLLEERADGDNPLSSQSAMIRRAE